MAQSKQFLSFDPHHHRSGAPSLSFLFRFVNAPAIRALCCFPSLPPICCLFRFSRILQTIDVLLHRCVKSFYLLPSCISNSRIHRFSRILNLLIAHFCDLYLCSFTLKHYTYIFCCCTVESRRFVFYLFIIYYIMTP